MKITKVYTRTGDKGQTSIVGGFRVSKASERLEAYGTVDELSSHLGLLASMLAEGEYHDMIIRIQNNLFNVCTNLATDQSKTELYDSAKLADGEIELLESEVDRMMKLLPAMSAGRFADEQNEGSWPCRKWQKLVPRHYNM